MATKQAKEWACQECGRRMTTAQAERAMSVGCPKCGGSDVDLAGNEVEAYGVRGMASKPWRRTFSSRAVLNRWAEAHDAEVHGTRETDGSIRRREQRARDAVLAERMARRDADATVMGWREWVQAHGSPGAVPPTTPYREGR